MTLQELSHCYEESARLLRDRIRQLQRQRLEEQDPERIWQLDRRMAELLPMLRQARELAELTAHYYDRGYWRNEKYTL